MSFYTSFKAAAEIGVTPKTLERWRKKGKFVPSHKTVGGHYRYSIKQVENAKKGVYEEPNVQELLG